MSGFDDLAIGTKYQFLRNAEHELIGSVRFEWEIGGTGGRNIGADSFSTISPALFLGKGFGDLPDSVWFLRPLAITAAFDLAIPLRASNKSVSFDEVSGEQEIEVENNPDVFEWGFAVQDQPHLHAGAREGSWNQGSVVTAHSLGRIQLPKSA